MNRIRTSDLGNMVQDVQSVCLCVSVCVFSRSALMRVCFQGCVKKKSNKMVDFFLSFVVIIFCFTFESTGNND